MEKSLLEDFIFMLPENPTNAEIEKAYKVLAQWYHQTKIRRGRIGQMEK